MEGVRLTHIGGPTVLIEVGGWRILTDPTFDPPGERYSFGWGTSSVKLSGPAVSVEDLGPIDVVLITHDHHADNLDIAGRALLASVPRIVTTTSGAGRLGPPAIPLATWGSTVFEGPDLPAIEVTATPCRHGPPLSHPITGDVIGFALRWDGQTDGVLWISGDTVLYDGVRQVADRLVVETAIVHVGAVRFPITGPLHYTMTIHDAVELCEQIGPKTVIPVHYEGWSHFREDRSAVEQLVAGRGQGDRPVYRLLPFGEAVDLSEVG